MSGTMGTVTDILLRYDGTGEEVIIPKGVHRIWKIFLFVGILDCQEISVRKLYAANRILDNFQYVEKMNNALTASRFYKEEEKTMRSGLGWQSLDPMEAVSAVHSIDNKKLLLRIAYEARNPEARRLALIKMGDKGLMASFARSDISPIVRRRMVRELDDIELVRRIAENDDDRSVRESAYQRLAQLEE